MVIGRLHPKRTALAVRVLLMLVGALGLAAGAGRAAQAPANTPPSTNQVKAQTPPPSNPNQSPVRVSGERSRTAPTKAARPEPRRTPTTRMAPAAPPKPINKQPAARVSGTPEREALAGAAGPESPETATPSALSTAAGRRDPFKPWVTPSSGHHAAGGAHEALPPGIRGLVISELRLEGIVREEASNAMIAVVTNRTKLAYFLRVNDTVYNGVVSRITPEAVYFKEKTLDLSGRVAAHEIEIKLGSAPGEER